MLLGSKDFAAGMARLGPYPAAPKLAVACSGGADSTALTLLAAFWARGLGGDALALIVDHGLRASSAAEAELTAQRLARRGIASRILTLSGLAGPGLQEKARQARYEILGEAALREGRLFLLLGHHAADQAETVAMRAQRGAGGAEGMAAWSARGPVVLLRPLLEVQPAALKAYLLAQSMAWVEDPSNADPRYERVRVREAGAGLTPKGAAERASREREAADYLARHASIRGEGFAIVDAPALPALALGALIRMLSGAAYKPRQPAVQKLAEALRPVTLGGVRIAPAGRLGPGWLLCREPAACAPEIPAHESVIWDGRFSLLQAAPPGHQFGALGGEEAKKFRLYNGLPALVLRTMPCLRAPAGQILFPAPAAFTPLVSATCHPFLT